VAGMCAPQQATGFNCELEGNEKIRAGIPHWL
jgi:hypothetical protein